MNKNDNINEKWRLLADEVDRRGGDGEATVSALKNLYSVYSSDMLLWLGSLFDARIGGFYYSASAKNSDCYLPDIESTYQALALLQSSGAISDYNEIPVEIRRRIAGFVCSLEDPDSGYFYHPQWSKELVNSKSSRKSRDLMWAVELSSWLDFGLPYPTAYARIKRNELSSADAEERIYASKESILAYLNSLNFEDRAVYSIHRVVSQTAQIRAAGLEDTVIDFFNGRQNKETGFWSDKINISAVNSFGSLTALYNNMGYHIPNVGKTLDILINSFFGEIPDREIGCITHIHKIWAACTNAIENIKCFGDEKERMALGELQKKLLLFAPRAITETAYHVARFKKPTSAFAANVNESPTTSQGVPITPSNTYGGDVNATVISVGIVKRIYKTLDLDEHSMRLFDSDDFKKFIYAIDLN